MSYLQSLCWADIVSHNPQTLYTNPITANVAGSNWMGKGMEELMFRRSSQELRISMMEETEEMEEPRRMYKWQAIGSNPLRTDMITCYLHPEEILDVSSYNH